MNDLVSLARRELLLAFRQGGSGLMGLAFFGLVVTLVPLGVGPIPDLLARIAPGILWIGAVLASLISLDRLFQADFEDGSLDLLRLAPTPLAILVAVKCLAHWAATAWPLIIAAPVLGLMLNLSPNAQWTLVFGLALGTPAFSFLGAIGAALTVGIRRGGLLLSLLALPFFTPTLIFGVLAARAAIDNIGQEVGPNLMLVAAVTLVSMVLGPLAAAGAIKISLS
jgi:heme exporter protein B